MVHISNGYIFESNGGYKEINFINGETVKLQAKGTGSYELYGKMRNGKYKRITLIDSELNVTSEAKDDNIYTADISGLSYITVNNVIGDIENIYYDIF